MNLLARLARAWDISPVGVVTLAGHVAVRNYAALDLNVEMAAWDQCFLMNVIGGVAGGGVPYTDFPL